jgi:hypothetical protein
MAVNRVVLSRRTSGFIMAAPRRWDGLPSRAAGKPNMGDAVGKNDGSREESAPRVPGLHGQGLMGFRP